MRRDTTRTADDLNRPEGNSLLENYEVHDVGERTAVERLEDLGLRVEAWGMDRRHDNNGLLFEDDKVDLKVFDGDELVALVEVKTKTSRRYMGEINERHYIKYKKIANEHGVPTFVWFFHVNGDGIVRDFFVPMHTQQDVVAATFNFPDGNAGVRFSTFYRWDMKVFQDSIDR